MARRFTPRHKAKPEEARREVPKPARFNQKPKAETGDLMYPLNRNMPEGITPLLDLGVRMVERTITETAQQIPTISLRAIADVHGSNDVLANFIEGAADQLHRQNQSRAIGTHTFEYSSFFSYEGTVYAVVQIDIDEGEGLDHVTVDGTRQRIPMRDGFITIRGEALPDIVKLKTGESA